MIVEQKRLIEVLNNKKADATETKSILEEFKV